jgi:GDPmannose 4,6-dehydratase
VSRGYHVFGGVRRLSGANVQRLRDLGVAHEVSLVELDLYELSHVIRTLDTVKPDEIYNLAAQSFVAASFAQPLYTAEINALGPLRLLEAIRQMDGEIRFYQASSSELFGKAQTVPQNECTSFHPRSPYGVAKLFAYWTTVNYRESYGLHASSGILFNHESPLRGREYVTRKITLGMAMIKHGQADIIELGNLAAERDWGFAGDFVDGIWRMVQQDVPADYVLATGETHSVRSFAEKVAAWHGYDIVWSGAAEQEIGIDRVSGRPLVRVNPSFYRPAEVELLVGSSQRAQDRLGWRRQVNFDQLVDMMCAADDRRVAEKNIPY